MVNLKDTQKRCGPTNKNQPITYSMGWAVYIQISIKTPIRQWQGCCPDPLPICPASK
jgi:hypothetical protein